MTYDKQALMALRDAVVDGHAYYKADFLLLGEGLYRTADSAYRGSLDAALSLLLELLPGQDVNLDIMEGSCDAELVRGTEEQPVDCSAQYPIPSRALLIAILNALIEECE